MKRIPDAVSSPHLQPTPWVREVGATLSLAVPLMLNLLAYMAIITTDIVMMGWLGPEALAAGSLAGHFYTFFDVFAMGVLGAVAPVLSHHLGARRFRRIRGTVRQGLWAAALVAVPCGVMIWHTEAILVALGQEPHLAASGQAYVRAMVAGLVPGLWLFVLSEFLAAHMRPRAILTVTAFGIALNALANYALMFGNFGFPRLELVGAGISSALVSTVMCASLLGFVLIDRRLRRYRLLGRFWRADWAALSEILRVGMPIAVAEIAEMGIFLAAGLLIGTMGTEPLAAHAIAAQCLALIFMLPGGMSQAAAVRVGRAAGAGDLAAAARAGWFALVTVAIASLLPAAVLWFHGEAIVVLFLDASRPENLATIEIAVSLLAVATAFQIVDAVQVVAMGALRGLKDTRGPMLITITGYWGVGLPAAALLGIYWEGGAEAVWIALAMALAVVAALLTLRFRYRSART